ncbi:hypothetical protein [Desulfosporosinus metallidurans]|nr:hypothetical protein [Desulfosporosinus metallidurans]
MAETKDEASTSQISICTENFSKEEIIMQVQIEEPREETSTETVIEEPREETSTETVIKERSEEPDEETLIEQLIEQGFNAKYSDNLDQAVNLFSKALSLDPIPDLALYLIIDCYWLWNNLGERDYAQTQLQVYIQKYLPQFNSDLRHQFDAWMTKENLHSLK